MTRGPCPSPRLVVPALTRALDLTTSCVATVGIGANPRYRKNAPSAVTTLSRRSVICHGAPPLSVAAAPQPMAVTAPAISLPRGCSRLRQHDGAAAGMRPGPLGPESTLPPSLFRPGCSSGVAPTQRHRVSKMAQGPGTKKCAPAPRQK